GQHSMDPHPNLTPEVIRGIGWLYVILFGMNVYWTLRAVRLKKSIGEISFWAMYSTMLGIIGTAQVTTRGVHTSEHFLIHLPLFVKSSIDALARAEFYFILSIALFAAVVWFREQLVKPTVAWIILNLMVLFMALSMTDYDFRQIVG